jgi:membrane-bound lytic murein transglycosylase D
MVGPHRGAGERRVPGHGLEERPEAGSAPTAQAQQPESSATAEAGERSSRAAPKPSTHRRGPIPREPRATLPEGAARAEPDAAVRRQVALGTPVEQQRAGKDDPELRALREAEEVLFPRPLAGATPGWSWDMPQPVDGLGSETVASGPPPETRLEVPAGTVEAASADAQWLHSLSMPNLGVRLDTRVVKYLKFYRDSAKGRAIAQAWAKKAGRFAPALKAELAKAGLPTDLVWLSLIESGHNPTIRSPAGAVGLWQFVADTARAYGLTVDRWVDERLDPRQSTKAAVRLLSDLNQRFGNWELAMAAYNMGHGGLVRAIRKFNTNDFWELCRQEAGIPWETALYVPKIAAIAIVMNNKGAFGIDRITPAVEERFDTIRVAPGVSLSRIAAAAEISVAALEELNPHLLAGRTPLSQSPARSSYPVAVPVGAGAAASRRLANTSGPGPTLEPYVVRFGDTPSTVAVATGTTVGRLRRINGLSASETLASGTVLLVPRASASRIQTGERADEVVVVPARQFRYPDRERVFYQVRGGDTLCEIASAFGVVSAELVAWNALDEGARLQPDMALQVFVKKGRSLDRVRHLRERETRILVAGSPEFFDYYEGLKGNKRVLVTVSPGDTLRSLGDRYGMTIGWMERVNRRSRLDPLVPGETIVVYVPRSAPLPAASATAGPQPKPLPPVQPPRPEALPPQAE